MPKPKRPMLGIIIVVVVLSASGAAVAASPRLRQGILARLRLGGSAPAEGELVASGFIEADEISIAAELGGRVVDLAVDEGEEVEAGQVLIRLDGTLLDAQIEARRQVWSWRRRGWPRCRPAHARRTSCRRRRWSSRPKPHATEPPVVARPAGAARGAQALDAQIAQARAQVAVAEAALCQATALKDAAEIAYDAFWDGQEALEEARQKLNQIPSRTGRRRWGCHSTSTSSPTVTGRPGWASTARRRRWMAPGPRCRTSTRRAQTRRI